MNVPLLDLTPQNTPLREEILAALTTVVDSNHFILGPEVEGLEKEIAAYCGTAFGVGVTSGTDALLVSLMAQGIGPGDMVLTTPYTFFATMGSIVRLGAKPCFVDIEEQGMNISVEAMAEALEKDRRNGWKIRAIMPVHLFGQCAAMEPILELASHYGVFVIEDAAQAIGSTCPVREQGATRWKRAGSMGICGCFSFFPSKNLGGIGDGGMVVCSDPELAENLKILRNHGSKPKYYHRRIGGNFRLDPVQAVVLRIKLRYLEKWHQARRDNAAFYRHIFAQSGLVESESVRLPQTVYGHLGTEGEASHIYNQFVIRARQRDQLRQFLSEHHIGSEVYYPLCLHQQECLASHGYGSMTFPVAEQAAAESLALPVYPGLSLAQMEYVVEQIAAFYRTLP